MGAIDPWNFSPAGPFDRMLAYWVTTIQRMQYNNDFESIQQCWELIGLGYASHTFHEENTIPPLIKIPRVDVAIWPDGRKIVMIRGTTSTRQLIGEILNAGLSEHPPWPGLTSNYFALATTNLRGLVDHLLTGTWTVIGHSLGAALASMFAVYGAHRVYSVASPRQGNLTYASGMNTPIHLRLTSQGDIGSLIPASTNTFLDQNPFTAPWPVAVNYRHWGIRRHLWEDGSLTLPFNEQEASPTEIARYIADNMNTGGWGNTHLSPEYCLRVRAGIPIAFPATEDDLDYPGIHVLDAMNFEWNPDEHTGPWNITGRGPVPPVVPGDILPSGATVLYQSDPHDFTFDCG